MHETESKAIKASACTRLKNEVKAANKSMFKRGRTVWRYIRYRGWKLGLGWNSLRCYGLGNYKDMCPGLDIGAHGMLGFLTASATGTLLLCRRSHDVGEKD